MTFDHDPFRIDLAWLRSLVFDAICGTQCICEELREECSACDQAVKNSGNQAAWQYVDTISMKMMEASEMLASRATHLRKALEERNRYSDQLEKESQEPKELLIRLLTDE